MYIAVLAAIVCVVTLFRFPLLGSKVHLGNAVCLLSGLLMGPAAGGLAAGFGSALNDALYGILFAAANALLAVVVGLVFNRKTTMSLFRRALSMVKR